MHKTLIAALLGLILSVSASLAGEIPLLSELPGKWKGEGTILYGNQKVTIQIETVFEFDIGGKFLKGTSTYKTPQGEGLWVEYYGWHPKTKEYVHIVLDSDGSAVLAADGKFKKDRIEFGSKNAQRTQSNHMILELKDGSLEYFFEQFESKPPITFTIKRTKAAP